MLDHGHGSWRRLDFGFEVSPSGGGLGLLLAEEAGVACATLIGYTPSISAPNCQAAVALVTATGLVQAVFGYPNEEAYWKDPRGGLGHGFFELVGSHWLDRVDDYNRRTFGADYSTWNLSRRPEPRPRHFFVGSKDNSAQFLACELEVEFFTERSYGDVRAEALARLDRL